MYWYTEHWNTCVVCARTYVHTHILYVQSCAYLYCHSGTYAHMYVYVNMICTFNALLYVYIYIHKYVRAYVRMCCVT